jgi:hypothetical protein
MVMSLMHRRHHHHPLHHRYCLDRKHPRRLRPGHQSRVLRALFEMQDRQTSWTVDQMLLGIKMDREKSFCGARSYLLE